MILINYFARYREQLNLGGEKLPLTASLRTIEDVRRLLMARGDIWQEVLGESNLMCALNQELCHPDQMIEDFDEIAFFPPVTGAEHMTVSVQYKAFDTGQLIDSLRANDPGVGAIVNFVGYVRDINQGEAVASLFLEHYPGMTERSLQKIIDNAKARWPLEAVTVVHRIGQLSVSDPIVFVGVSSQHRQAAFDACAFIMDYLKTDAPFWKREDVVSGSRWVDARDSDRSALERWALMAAKATIQSSSS